MTASSAELGASNTNTMNFFYHGSHDITPSSLMLPQLEVVTPTLIATHTVDSFLNNPSDAHFGDFEMAYFGGQVGVAEPHLGSADEARYNLATRIMSNGVEVIIAGDKSKTIEPSGNNNHSNNSNAMEQKSQILRILQTPINKPVTLAPSTLQDQMFLVKPTNVQENYTIPMDANNFITKTCLTTYTYRTTYLQDGHTTVESREKVISNIATEERNYLNLSPTVTSGVILSRTPEFAVGVFHTSYTYYNTIMNGELPLVVSSEHTVTNTITGPDVYISFLQPSEDATPVLETNTYYSKITLTKTLRGDAALQKVVSMSNIMTQVIVTESLPSRSTSVMTSYYAFDVSENNEPEPSGNEHSLITAQPQKSTSNSPPPPPTAKSPLAATSASDYDLHIYATKTYLTTFTYLTTTLLKSATSIPTTSITLNFPKPTPVSSTIVNYHTRIIENVITETVPSSMLRSDLLKHFRSELKNPKNERKIIVTLATLSGGQTLQVTAMNILKNASTKHPETTAVLKASSSSSSKKTATSSHKAKISKTRKSTAKTAQPKSSISATRTAYIAPTHVKAASVLAQTQTKKATLHTPTFNEIEQEEDSAVASSEQENVYISNELPSNSTKTSIAIAKPPGSSSKLPGTVNQLIGSLNLNRLNALRPVFNAMAGLLHNNFGGGGVGSVEHYKPIVSPAAPSQFLQIESKHALRNISSHAANYDPAVNSYGSHGERPIYIPVKNMANDGEQQSSGSNAADIELNPAQLSPQSLHIQPPAADVAISDDNWRQEAASKLLQYGKQSQQHIGNSYNAEVRPRDPIASYETPLINGGIPISPGEVITANSDVIIGKPNGIQHPRVPYSSANIPDNSAAANTQIVLMPPPEAEPATTFYQHFIQHPPYEKSALRQTNAIPFLRHNFETQAFNEPPRQQQHKHLTFASTTNFDNILKPPAVQPNSLPPSYIQPPPPPSPATQQHKYTQQPQPQQQLIGFSPPGYSEHKYYTIDPDQQQMDFNFNKELQHNEILEIKRIPEVYSTDLPPDFEAKQQPAREAQYAAGISQPLLVDVQPSRITNVLIPHGASDGSALVLTSSSTSGPHKHGQYYNEPNPHLSNIGTKQPAESYATPTITTIMKTTTPKASITLQATQAKTQKDKLFPASNSNHQKINFDMHVLSHNVDINAPPLTFKKESEFPHSVPVRGHIPNDMVSQQPSNFYSFPLVKIPLNKENIQVELTPQNVIGSVDAPTIAQQALTKQQQQQYELDASTFGSFALPMPQNEKNFAIAKQQLATYGSFNKLSANSNNNLKVPERHRVASKTNNYSQSEHVSILENPFTISNEQHRIVPGAPEGFNNYGQKISPPFIPTKQKNALHHTSITITHSTTAPLRVQAYNKSNFNEPFYPPIKAFSNQGQHLTLATSPRPTQSQKYTQRPILRPTKKRYPSVSSDEHFGNKHTSDLANQHLRTNITPKPTNTTLVSVSQQPTIGNWNQNLVTYEDDLTDGTTNTFDEDQNAAPSLNSIRLPAPQENFLSTQNLNKNNWEQVHHDIILQPFLSEMSIHTLTEMNEQKKVTTTTPLPTTMVFSTMKPTKKHNETPYKGLLPSQGRPFQASNQTNKWSSSKSNERIKQHIFVATGEGFKKPNVTDKSSMQALQSVNQHANRTQLRSTTSAPLWEFSNTMPASTTVEDLSTSPFLNEPTEQQETQTKMKTKENDDEIFDFHETSNPHNYGSVNTTKTTSATNIRHHTAKPLATTLRPPSKKRPNTVADIRNGTALLHNNPYYKYRPVLDIRPPLQPEAVAETEAVVGLNPPPPPAPTPSALPTPTNSSPAKTSTPYKTINYTSIKRLPLVPLPQLNNDLKLQTTRQPTKEKVILKPPPLPSPTTPTYVERTLPSSLTPPSVASNVFKPIQYNEMSITLSMATITPALSSTPKQISTSIHTSPKTNTASTLVLKPSISKAADRRKNATDSHKQRIATSSRPHKTSEQIVVVSSEYGLPAGIPQIKNHDLAIQSSLTESTQFEEKKIAITPTKTAQSEATLSANRKPVAQIWSRNSNTSKLPPNQHRANTQILRLSSKRIILPTRFITNTQILTVTTTETTVLTTAGKQSTKTLTLIKTQTATILDTVTEIHTLVQPTRVIESKTHLATSASTLSATASYNIPSKTHAGQPNSNEGHDQHLANHKPYHEHKNDAFEVDAAGHPSIEVVLADAAVKHQKQSHRPPAQQPLADTEVTPLHNDPSKNSIFIVMTDSNSKSGGASIININPNMIETAHNINAIGVTASENIGAIGGIDEEALDYDDNISFDLPSRDEETVSNVGKANHVLLGGVLIATPPKSSSSSGTAITKKSNELGTAGSIATLICHPACKASRNEVCMHVHTRVRCICRPGFARMFPDRPCKPTYTYAMRIHVHRLANNILRFERQLMNNESEDFRQLATITHDAVDRMVMQSDFRDVYHGVHLTSFEAGEQPTLATSSKELEDDIVATMLLQLSDNSDEDRLGNVFKKYLRLSNYSIGGTELYTTKNGVENMAIVDFDECKNTKFHDCSANARCFNLQGSYTCSCQEGYVDLSENPVYPGRICSAEIIGCEKCNYHGKCVTETIAGSNKTPICECFAWYTGASCQLNLKILLIALIAVGTLLFILLLFCVLVTCSKRHKHLNARSLMHASMHKIASKNSRLSVSTAAASRHKSQQLEKRAMIKDSSSETSLNSIPYVLNDTSSSIKQHKMHGNSSCFDGNNLHAHSHYSAGTGSVLITALEQSINELHHHFPEQSDRSLTVMIPRAKYHPTVLPQAQFGKHHQLGIERTEQQQQHKSSLGALNAVIVDDSNETENMQVQTSCNLPVSKAIDAKQTNKLKKMSTNSSKHNGGGGGMLAHANVGSLVSAGFEVSATVSANFLNSSTRGALHSSSTTSDGVADVSIGVADNDVGKGFGDMATNSGCATANEFHQQLLPSYMTEVRKTEQSESHESEYNTYKDGEELIESMDMWLDNIHQTELTAEARSFDETVVQATTKSKRCGFDSSTSQTNDEANTMTERDIGSTFLLPHTHLYKPDRQESETSGFDFI